MGLFDMKLARRVSRQQQVKALHERRDNLLRAATDAANHASQAATEQQRMLDELAAVDDAGKEGVAALKRYIAAREKYRRLAEAANEARREFRHADSACENH